ncbi:unnamed protein product [Prunus armeniaca]|uniref:Uncharacterized protein n=1 Tax=Prunus armeniaca TaxID=36596 RepID=A0A6J5Y3C2_PRUAR|nr:unnamed protein product [Prunus armeniaca]
MKLLFQKKLKAHPSFNVDTSGLKKRGCSHQPQQCCPSSRVVLASLRGAFTNATTANEAVKLRSWPPTTQARQSLVIIPALHHKHHPSRYFSLIPLTSEYTFRMAFQIDQHTQEIMMTLVSQIGNEIMQRKKNESNLTVSRFGILETTFESFLIAAVNSETPWLSHVIVLDSAPSWGVATCDSHMIGWMNLSNCWRLCDNLAGVAKTKEIVLCLIVLSSVFLSQQSVFEGNEFPKWFSCCRDFEGPQ